MLTLASATPRSEWSVLGNDTVNLTWTPLRLTGAAGLRFDKADGSDNTKIAGAARTVAAVDLARRIEPHDQVFWPMIVPDVTNVDYALLRIGTDASNCLEYRYADTSLTAGRWCLCRASIGEGRVVGVGADLSAVSYVAVGVAFDAEGNTLANIVASAPYASRKVLSD